MEAKSRNPDEEISEKDEKKKKNTSTRMKHGSLNSGKLVSRMNSWGPKIELHSLILSYRASLKSDCEKTSVWNGKLSKWVSITLGRRKKRKGRNNPCHQLGPGGWVVWCGVCLFIYWPIFSQKPKAFWHTKAVYLLDDTWDLPKIPTFFTH